jgi:outer membrane biosynthesis protein TonB
MMKVILYAIVGVVSFVVASVSSSLITNSINTKETETKPTPEEKPKPKVEAEEPKPAPEKVEERKSSPPPPPLVRGPGNLDYPTYTPPINQMGPGNL